MKPHGTRTRYRGGCRCAECTAYQSALSRRARLKVQASGGCLDCLRPYAGPHRRCDGCRDIRNKRQRTEYRPLPRMSAPRKVATHTKPETPRAPASWWAQPQCQVDRQEFSKAASERVTEMQARGISYRASWMEAT